MDTIFIRFSGCRIVGSRRVRRVEFSRRKCRPSSQIHPKPIGLRVSVRDAEVMPVKTQPASPLYLRPRAVVNLAFFPGWGFDDRPHFRRRGAAYVAHESSHVLITARAPVAVHQVLPDSHRVPAAFQLLRGQFTVRFATARRSTTPQPVCWPKGR
jgi:hypothetical protein